MIVNARELLLMIRAAERISETLALDLDDMRITTRKNVLAMMGKGEMGREVPLNALVRQILDEWLGHRATIAGRWRADVVGQPDRLSAVGTLRRPERPDGRRWRGA